MHSALLYGVPILLIAAALRDVATRTIPDGFSIALAAAGCGLRATEGPLAVVLSLGSAALLFLLLVPLHARGMLGGADLKLGAAVAVGLPPFGTMDFLLLTALAGGVLGCVYLALARLPSPQPFAVGIPASLPGRVLAVERRRIRRRGPLPYAVAIACGGTLVRLIPAGG
nr:prepilin peptidase [Falsiroseomonas tokyonensis]